MGRVVAQELVDRGELGPHARGLAPGGLDRTLGLTQRAAGLLGAGVSLLAGFAGLGERGVQLGDLGGGVLAGAVELGQLALQLLLALALQPGELLLERADALADLRAVPVGLRRTVAGEGLLEDLQLALHAEGPLGERVDSGGGLLAAQLQALLRGAGSQRATGERVVALGAVGERALGVAAAPHDLLQARFDSLAGGAGLLHAGLGARRAPGGARAAPRGRGPAALRAPGAPGAGGAPRLRPGA